ncbi:MAG: SRPBCC family protein [Porticoccaceae bacterium]|nr:SRPBCC family protein [Porticoccaceae bacterium]MDG1475340.1 SRPBCC family protein [Porticoccaceae bacterium]
MAIKIEHHLLFSADEVWRVLGTPDRVDWVPGVKSCLFDGEVRCLDLPGAGTIKERILLRDNSIRRIEYSCFESPGALLSHHASMQIIESENGCTLHWEANVEPVEIENFVKPSMQGSLDQLEKVLSSERNKALKE